MREGLRNVAAGANPMAIKRGIEAAVDEAVEAIKKASKEISGKEDIARVATISARDRGGRRRHCRRHREGRQGRRGQRRGVQHLRPRPRVHRGHAVRQGLSQPLPDHRSGAHGVGPRPIRTSSSPTRRSAPSRISFPSSRRSSSRASSFSSSPKTSRARPWPPSSSTSCAARSPVSPSRPPVSVTGASACSKTSPSSPAARSSPKRWVSSSRTPTSRSSAAPQGRRDQGQHDDHRRRRRRLRRSRVASSRSRARSRPPTPTSTARSSRSVSPSWPAASPSSRSARPPKSR